MTNYFQVGAYCLLKVSLLIIVDFNSEKGYVIKKLGSIKICHTINKIVSGVTPEIH